MDGIFTIGAIIALLLAAGGAIAALTGRGGVSFRWLFVAAGLVLLNDALLTRFYRLVPDLIHGHWNWQGKLTALLVLARVACFLFLRCSCVRNVVAALLPLPLAGNR